MKLTDCTSKPPADNLVQKALVRMRAMLPFLRDHKLKAQETVLVHFQRGLDNRYHLLRNVALPGLELPIPFILVGPVGIVAINVSTAKGLYRAREENWLEMNKTTRRYQPAFTNLLKQSLSLTQGLASFLNSQEIRHPDIAPVMIFVDPGVHIEPNRPAVRLVLADGIDRLVSSLAHSGEVLKGVQIKVIVDAIEKVAKPEAVIETGEDILGKDLGLDKPAKGAPQPPRPMPQLNLPPFLANLNFTKRQWFLLVVFVLGNIALLIGLILFILFTAR